MSKRCRKKIIIIIRAPPTYLVCLSPSLFGWGSAGITPVFTNGQAEVSPLHQEFLAHGGICFHHVRSLAGHTLMPAWRQGADPLTFARYFLPSLAHGFNSLLIPTPDWSVAPEMHQASMWEQKGVLAHLVIIQMRRLRPQEERREPKAQKTARMRLLSRLTDWSKIH